MTLKEMRELARAAFKKGNVGRPTEDYTKIANAGSEHDPHKLQKEVRDDKESTY